MQDVYEQLYNSLGSVGYPSSYAGYNIQYYEAIPISIESLNYPEEVDWLLEVEDTNQADIIVSDDYGVVDKITQMWHLISLLPQVVQKGLFDE